MWAKAFGVALIQPIVTAEIITVIHIQMGSDVERELIALWARRGENTAWFGRWTFYLC